MIDLVTGPNPAATSRRYLILICQRSVYKKLNILVSDHVMAQRVDLNDFATADRRSSNLSIQYVSEG